VKRLWVLNLDAERELALPDGYTRPRVMAEQIRERSASTRDLVRDEPVLALDATEAPEGASAETVVVAWCPTPSAVALVRRVGLTVPAAPPLDVLRLANHRRFQHDVARRADDGAPFFAHTAFVEPDADLEMQVRSLAQRLSNPPPLGAGWHLERAYGFAGKGARRLTGPPKPDDVRWLRDSLARGGILVEPWVPIVRELSLHGFVAETSVVFGEPCALACDEFGAPTSVTMLPCEPGTFTTEHAVPRLRDAARTAAESLRSIGYFGPFGIDAFVFRGEHGEHLNPISDLNARFTLGWSTGMGDKRESALALCGRSTRRYGKP
jgi:hypothetical protein